MGREGLIKRVVMVHCVWDLNLDKKIDQVVGVMTDSDTN